MFENGTQYTRPARFWVRLSKPMGRLGRLAPRNRPRWNRQPWKTTSAKNTLGCPNVGGHNCLWAQTHEFHKRNDSYRTKLGTIRRLDRRSRRRSKSRPNGSFGTRSPNARHRYGRIHITHARHYDECPTQCSLLDTARKMSSSSIMRRSPWPESTGI